MKALSIRQPWAWFILCGHPWAKDVENRDWQHLCRERGNLLIHAAKGMTKKEYDDACKFARTAGATMFPQFDDLKRGGIVGMVKLVDHVRRHKSKWFEGPTALVFTDPYPLPFRPYPGQLGFFEVE
jgi:hypothetical protein